MYHAYVTTLKNVRKHPNADRLLLGECFDNTVCVSLDFYEGQTVVYFPVDGQLSEEFAHMHHLCRKTKDGQPDTGYLEPDKRNIRAIKLRGEKSDGLAMPLSCLEPFGDISSLSIGDTVEVFNGHEICKKYIPKVKNVTPHKGGNHARKHKEPIAPLFAEHADTEQLAYNLEAFKPGDLIEITLKVHGTSGRTGYLPKLQGYNDTFSCKASNALRRIFTKMLHFSEPEPYHNGDPIYDWGYVTGTRRVVLDTFDGGFYGNNHFREPHARFFEGKLWKGETVYYEIAGFTDSGAPIMPSVSNKPTNDKKFIKQYGETTTFSYGCNPGGWQIHPPKEDDPDNVIGYIDETPQSRIFVYRMTMTNPDGEVVEYTPDFMRYRCEQMGAECVPVFTKFYLDPVDLDMDERSPGEIVKDIAEKYYDGPDPIGKTHVREGVVVRIVNRPKFTAYKHKNWYFKCIEGIAKDSASAPDLEEAQEVEENDEYGEN